MTIDEATEWLLFTKDTTSPKTHKAINTVLEKVKQYEEMFEGVHRISSYKNSEEWDLIYNSGSVQEPTIGWFFRHDLNTFYDTPLEAFDALKAQRNSGEEE